jgi:hypothetical protein
MIKFRDLWDPHQRTIFAQYNTTKANTFYDERIDKLVPGSTSYKYTAIELLAVTPITFEAYRDSLALDRQPFGLLVNVGYSNLGEKGRLHQIKYWTRGLGNVEIFGTWCEDSQRDLQRTIEPVPLHEVTRTLARWQTTMTFPATGGGWATAKPWECFNAGTLCFKHPRYDDQHHIYSHIKMTTALGAEDAKTLHEFLCPVSPQGVERRLAELQSHPDLYTRLADLQRAYLQWALEEYEDGGREVLRLCRHDLHP